MDRRRDDRAGYAQPLGNVAFHLRAQHQFGLQRLNGIFDRQVIVGDQRFDTVKSCRIAQIAGEFAVVAAKAHHFEAQLVTRHACRGNGMRGVAENEHAFAGQIGRIDRAAPPRQVRRIEHGGRIDARQARHFGDEITRRAVADRHGAHGFLPELAFQPATGRIGDFGIEADVEIGLAQPRQIGGAGPQRGGYIDGNAQGVEQPGDFDHIVAMPEPKRGRPQQIDAGPGGVRARCRRGTGAHRTHQVVEGFGRAPVLFALVAGQFERDHRAWQPHRLDQPGGIVLDQLGRARCADQHGLRLEPVEGIACRRLEQLCGVLAQIARLERGVGNRRTLGAAFDHREQQVGIGIALRCVEDIVNALHGGCDPHRANVRGTLVCPDRQLHQTLKTSRRRNGRVNSSARSPAWSKP